MIVTGIIAEYNPFHLGHAYQIAKARELTGADYIVVVMSPDFVQRGAPALLDKRTRTRMALLGGADLVLELPVRLACSGAADFADGAVSILQTLGVVNYLCFGSESGDISDFLAITDLLLEESPAFQEELRQALRAGCTYPAARQRALLHTIKTASDPSAPTPCMSAETLSDFLSGPNNTLGLEYVQALHRRSSTILPVTVARTQDNYHDFALSGRYASASAIRRAVMDSDLAYEAYVPSAIQPMLQHAQAQHAWLEPDDLSGVLGYCLLQATPASLANCLEMPQGLANRMLSTRNSFQTFTQYAALLKTRDITYARICRILCHLVLGLTKTSTPPSCIRMLGFRKTAAQLLSAIKAHSQAPVLGKLGTDTAASYQDDLFASNLYQRLLTSKSHTCYMEERQQQLVIYTPDR